MKLLTTCLLNAVLGALLAAPLAQAQEHTAPGKRQQFLYMLRVAPHLQDEAKWSEKDKQATSKHFERLKQATDKGQVILAGRTSEALDKTFGLVIFEAENEAAARKFMQEDPAVQAGVMQATLHPYSVALQRRVDGSPSTR
ncbi:YciI family protein [Massilia niastensis]|uniref:YciI family protein n=1 Tax=Massilia niastensis TaxID=544911 RepID=UPI000376ACCA|nr:YciI family protein [Massilia niastensis]